MNIAYFLTPKSRTAFLEEDSTLRQGLEKMRHYGYTAIPVVTPENKYVSTVSEGDFLWYLVDRGEADDKQNGHLKKFDMKSLEDMYIRDILQPDRNPPVRIGATMEELLASSMTQNFIPVIDDRDCFIGIVTRSAILNYFSQSHAAAAEVPQYNI